MLRVGAARPQRGRGGSRPGGGYRGGVANEQWAGAGPAGHRRRRADGQFRPIPARSSACPKRAAFGLRHGLPVRALFIDWILCAFIATALLHSQYWALAIFGAETWILTALTGTTIGKRLLGLRVARLDGRPVGLGWGLVRTLLLLAVVPPLVTDRDRRGLHDKAANTIVVRM